MTDFQKIEALFHATMEKPASEREQFVRSQTNDIVLIEEVLSLINSAEGETLSSPLQNAAGQMYESLDDNFVGSELGHYRITQRIGAGGMGTVYKAERADGVFDKLFAIKIVKKGMDSEHIVQRFKMERSILARLSHPNIAGVIDGGITDDGRPYFVMDYVEGKPINTYCDSNNLSVQQRIGLFRTVCEAVHYAHQNLVIHRDLKPSNILVTEEGQIKLLDFGIAKLLDEDQDGELTQTNMMLFTPAYAAPEQFLNSKLVSTSIDIYALGVILYELLSGRRPFVASRTAEEYRIHVLTSEPPKPSTVISRHTLRDTATESSELKAEDICKYRGTVMKALQKNLQGDLDIICLMALRPEPDKRYLSAEQLAADLSRHLNLQPIIARPDSFAYRFNRLFARHRPAFIAGLLATMVFLTTVMFYTRQLTKERDLALREQERTQEVVQFVTRLFHASDPMEGGNGEITARELLDEGAIQVKAELQSRPEIYAQLSHLLGEIYFELGDENKATEFLQAAAFTQERLYGENSADSVATNRVIGQIHQNNGDYGLARKHLTLAYETAIKHFGEVHNEIHECLLALAYLTETDGNYAEAEVLYKKSLDVAKQLNSEDKTERVAKSMSDLAGLYRFQDRFPEAEALLREALAMQQNYFKEEHLHTLSTKRILAGLLREADRFEESEALYKNIIQARTEILGPEHIEVLHTWNSYSQLLDKKGDSQGALDAISNVIDTLESTRKGTHVSLPALYHNRAYYQKSLKLYDAAIADFDLSIKTQDAVGMEADHPNRAYPIEAKGTVQMDLERWEDAKQSFLLALEIRYKHFDKDHRLILPVRSKLGKVLTELGEHEEAEIHLREIIQPNIDKHGPEHDETQISVERLIKVYELLGQQDQVDHYRGLLIKQNE